MQQKFTLSIDQPCSEKFGNFKPTKKGGFCQSCQKEIIDFTQMTEHELIEYFKNRPQPQNTCGRFAPSQLNRTYAQIPKSRKKSFLSLFGIGLMGLSMFLPSQGQANNPNSTTKIQIFGEYKSEETNKREVKNDGEFTVTGIVTDEEGEPIFGATVVIKGTDKGVITQFDGKFSIKVKVDDVLIVSYIGYLNQEVTIKKKHITLDIIAIEADVAWMGEISVNEVYYSKPTIWQKIKAIFKRKN